MWVARTLYDSFVIIYGISLVFFFFDSMQPRRWLNRTAVALLFIAFSFETLFLFSRLYALGYAAVYSRFDTTLLLSWLILLTALCFNAFFRMDVLLFFVNVIAFGMVVADAVSRQQASGYENQPSDLLVIHIVSAVASYGAFSLAGAFSTMYLIQSRLLKQKRWHSMYFRLPALDTLDRLAYRSVSIGYPLLTVAMALGVVWQKLSLGHYIFLDSKTMMTLTVWLLYGLYIFLRTKSGWGGNSLARFSIICFLCILLNLWLAGRFSSFHH